MAALRGGVRVGGLACVAPLARGSGGPGRGLNIIGFPFSMSEIPSGIGWLFARSVSLIGTGLEVRHLREAMGNRLY